MDAWMDRSVGQATCPAMSHRLFLPSIARNKNSDDRTGTDPAYAEELLLHARRLFDFAYKHQAMCQVSAPYYQSTGFIDELAYAAGAFESLVGRLLGLGGMRFASNSRDIGRWLAG